MYNIFIGDLYAYRMFPLLPAKLILTSVTVKDSVKFFILYLDFL